MSTRRLLVVTGDYGVVQQVKQALNSRNFAIHVAYSHLDALYQLKYETFELVLVDASMTSHSTRERTALALAKLERHPPLMIYAPSTNGADSWEDETLITALSEEMLMEGV